MPGVTKQALDHGSKTQLAPILSNAYFSVLSSTPSVDSCSPILIPGVGGLGRNRVVRSGEEPRLTQDSPSIVPSCMVGTI